jgi:LPS-assembly protein
VDYGTRFVGPRLERDFGTWRHVLEPSLEYRYRAGARRFHETIVVDETDLLANTSEIEYAVTNRFMAGHEFLSWRVAQTLFFDPTFGGVIVPGARNVFSPLLELTGFAFADGERRFSPIVSTVRISTTPQTSTDIQVDYDTVEHEFRSAGIIGEANRGPLFSAVSYFLIKRSGIEAPSNQIRGLVGYGNQDKPGISAAMNVAYDFQRSLFQGSTLQVGYNTDCYGLSVEFSQVDLGARKESRFRFELSLKNLGSIGTIRRQERLF